MVVALLVFPMLQFMLVGLSSEARILIRRLEPESEQALLCPHNDWILAFFLPSLLGGFRLAALAGDLPPSLQFDPSFRVCIRRARIVLGAKVLNAVLLSVLFGYWIAGG